MAMVVLNENKNCTRCTMFTKRAHKSFKATLYAITSGTSSAKKTQLKTNETSENRNGNNEKMQKKFT